MSYSDLEYEIFSRQFILQDFNEENIQKLNKAKITIVGLGGIGCPLTQYLVSSGIKNFTFFDGDLIEKSNLARQILYSLEDIGKFKTLVAKEKLLKTNPNKLQKEFESMTSMKSFVSKESIASIAIYLLSNNSINISGQAIAVDGHTERMN